MTLWDHVALLIIGGGEGGNDEMRESTNTCAADTWKDKARKCSCHTAVLLLLWTSSQLRTLMLWAAWTLVKASIAYLLNYIATKVTGNNANTAKCLKLQR